MVFYDVLTLKSPLMKGNTAFKRLATDGIHNV